MQALPMNHHQIKTRNEAKTSQLKASILLKMSSMLSRDSIPIIIYKLAHPVTHSTACLGYKTTWIVRVMGGCVVYATQRFSKHHLQAHIAYYSLLCNCFLGLEDDRLEFMMVKYRKDFWLIGR